MSKHAKYQRSSLVQLLELKVRKYAFCHQSLFIPCLNIFPCHIIYLRCLFFLLLNLCAVGHFFNRSSAISSVVSEAKAQSKARSEVEPVRAIKNDQSAGVEKSDFSKQLFLCLLRCKIAFS